MNQLYIYILLLALKYGPAFLDLVIDLIESFLQEGKEVTLEDIIALKDKLPDEDFIPSTGEDPGPVEP